MDFHRVGGIVRPKLIMTRPRAAPVFFKRQRILASTSHTRQHPVWSMWTSPNGEARALLMLGFIIATGVVPAAHGHAASRSEGCFFRVTSRLRLYRRESNPLFGFDTSVKNSKARSMNLASPNRFLSTSRRIVFLSRGKTDGTL
ncbi:hypothetical protein MPTK1_2g17170 [Marchantia polymorpha subsp. ruderalis]|uniref:Uncharacterized protein n=1 Tax=Marchantia polymorpha TaxID=3197 RepID=A0A2R6WCR2_MARPO|nr:hypothetical protein MARPO_0109s0058 [Marchantia polymorpha]BBN02680.1 hypothetical protein Mp_2g17170 [Marchantia polymorpha subsp. ruderalis]|eukprot:PTQ31638.1 hypothetical protein MARPO_0109s0058 [Marchantia polymorpha]